MRMFLMIASVAAALLLSACSSPPPPPDGITVVQNFNTQCCPERWYKIARLDHSFESSLEKVTATYSLRNEAGWR
ncbi:MAG: hypothetical protein H6R25_848 [Proteobacteria bacterium]|nr:hypothetical protein [Pseudomonadota bacterium]